MATSRTTTDNAATIADVYAAFGRGDVAAILDRLAPDVACGRSGMSPPSPSAPAFRTCCPARDRLL
jgi:ketosteroid isomerase-like protein